MSACLEDSDWIKCAGNDLRPWAALLLRIQRLVKEHLDVGLIRQPSMCREGLRAREIVFREPDGDSWGGLGLASLFTGRPRHCSFSELARSFGLLEAIRSDVLV